jgi:hypothetical protein
MYAIEQPDSYYYVEVRERCLWGIERMSNACFFCSVQGVKTPAILFLNTHISAGHF